VDVSKFISPDTKRQTARVLGEFGHRVLEIADPLRAPEAVELVSDEDGLVLHSGAHRRVEAGVAERVGPADALILKLADDLPLFRFGVLPAAEQLVLAGLGFCGVGARAETGVEDGFHGAPPIIAGPETAPVASRG
jgi:hypothetical protein